MVPKSINLLLDKWVKILKIECECLKLPNMYSYACENELRQQSLAIEGR